MLKGVGMELGLRDKVAVVTGAARGLGKAIALAPSDEGAKLALLDVERDTLQETAAGLDNVTSAISLHVDVSDEVEVRQAVEEVVRAYGRIDILVNNAGIASFTRAGASHGIRVNALAPAFIESAMMPPEDRDKYLPLVPLGRMGTPEDVASSVLFLASDRARFITGELLDVNGGALMD
jgi:NAD(P)-dependent dehydrogenase (short-subunit alcohol dehydrogenase family)